MPLPIKCSLCFRDLSNTQCLGRLPCLHVFHFNCVYINLLRVLECPECKKALPALSDIQKFSVNAENDKDKADETKLLKTELEQSLKNSGGPAIQLQNSFNPSAVLKNEPKDSEQTVETRSKVSAQLETKSSNMSELQKLRHECTQNFEFLKQVNAQLDLNCRISNDLQNRLNNAEKTATTTNELKTQFIKMSQEMAELRERMFQMEKMGNAQKQQFNEDNEGDKSSTAAVVSIPENTYTKPTQHMSQELQVPLMTAATYSAPIITNKTVNDPADDKDYSDASERTIALKNRIINDLEHKLRETTLVLEKEMQNSKLLSAHYEKLQKYVIAMNMPDSARAALKEKHNVWSAYIPNDGVAAAMFAGALTDAQCVKHDKIYIKAIKKQ